MVVSLLQMHRAPWERAAKDAGHQKQIRCHKTSHRRQRITKMRTRVASKTRQRKKRMPAQKEQDALGVPYAAELRLEERGQQGIGPQ